MIPLTVKKAGSLHDAIIGLIGAKNPYGLCLFTRFGVHTFGVRFPLDIVILDKQDKIVRIKERLLPNRLFFWPPIWQCVLELPQGTIQEKKLHIGDTIALTFAN